MNELEELRLKGELAEHGFLTEKYADGDLQHSLTDKGRCVVEEMLRHKELQRDFLKMAVAEAKKLPFEQGKTLVISAMQKIREANQ